jgi:hypothetical protein
VYLDLGGMKRQEGEENCIMRRCIVCSRRLMIKSKKMRWSRHVARIGGLETCTILVGKREGK